MKDFTLIVSYRESVDKLYIEKLSKSTYIAGRENAKKYQKIRTPADIGTAVKNYVMGPGGIW